MGVVAPVVAENLTGYLSLTAEPISLMISLMIYSILSNTLLYLSVSKLQNVLTGTGRHLQSKGR